MRKPIHLRANRRFHKLVLVETVEQQNSKLGETWLCKCDCGNYTKALACDLLHEKKKSCGCLRKKSYGSISGTFFYQVRNRAKYAELEFKLTIEFLDKLLKKQNYRCALSGLPIYIVQGRFTLDTTASVDRIDNDRGYTEDNVQFVHKEINQMRGSLPIDKFIDLCKEVTDHHER